MDEAPVPEFALPVNGQVTLSWPRTSPPGSEGALVGSACRSHPCGPGTDDEMVRPAGVSVERAGALREITRGLLPGCGALAGTERGTRPPGCPGRDRSQGRARPGSRKP